MSKVRVLTGVTVGLIALVALALALAYYVPGAESLGQWFGQPKGLLVVALVGIIALLLAVPASLASIGSFLHGDRKEHPRIGYATYRLERAGSWSPWITLVYHPPPPASAAGPDASEVQAMDRPATLRDLVLGERRDPPTGGVIGGAYMYRARVWNTGDVPLENVVLSFQLRWKEGKSPTSPRDRERIEFFKVEHEPGGPRLALEQQDLVTLEGTCDLLNSDQRAEVILYTIRIAPFAAEPELVVFAKARGLPPPVLCEWEYERAGRRITKPTPKKADNDGFRLVPRSGPLGWAGRALYGVGKPVWRLYTRLATKLAHRRVPEGS